MFMTRRTRKMHANTPDEISKYASDSIKYDINKYVNFFALFLNYYTSIKNK